MAFAAAGAPIGIDVGTSAVRAAQVTSGRRGHSLTSFAQVALPPGAVSEGEIRDQGTVAEAVAQLRKRVKLRGKAAVVGVANQRVVVRQVDLPFLEEKEFRSSLRFQVADHIPMPVESAELDYDIIGEFVTESGERMMRVLLVAAATDMINEFLGAVSSAGLEPAGVDLSPFAAARAVSPAARGEAGLGGSEAIVDIGAGKTSVVVHQNGEPSFVRILMVGGNEATRALADRLNISFEQAEALKLDVGRGLGHADAQRILQTEVGRLVDEVRGSLDYYLTLEDSAPVVSVVATGGGVLTPGLLPTLEQSLNLRIRRATPLRDMETGKSGLAPEQIAQVETVAAVAVGLAMGASER